MPEKNFSPSIDVAAPIAEKIEAVAAAYRGRYALNKDVYNRILYVYKMLRKIALQNDGGIKDVKVDTVDRTIITVEVPSMDLFREELAAFSELLGMINSLDVSASSGELLSISVGITGLWKAV